MTARSAARALVLGLVLWALTSWLSTSYAPAPVDCYERASWDGRAFVGSCEWRCF